MTVGTRRRRSPSSTEVVSRSNTWGTCATSGRTSSTTSVSDRYARGDQTPAQASPNRLRAPTPAGAGGRGRARGGGRGEPVADRRRQGPLLRHREGDDLVAGCPEELRGEHQHRLRATRALGPVVADEQDAHGILSRARRGAPPAGRRGAGRPGPRATGVPPRTARRR